jgi:HK97 gp10 family phage protein
MADNPVTCKISGLDDLQKTLQEKLPADARKFVRIALSAGGGDVKRAMVANAPVEEGGEHAGFLAAHINVKTRLTRGELAGTAFIGPSTAVYPDRQGKPGTVKVAGKTFHSEHAGQVTAARVARFLEFGTSRMGKKPFMTQAWDSSKQTALDHIIAKLKEVLGV